MTAVAIGIDLAWSTGRTGLCAVDGRRVLASTVVDDDDEIVAWVEQHSVAGMVVGIDAPIIVKNATGCRGPERVVASAWGAAHASCHVANLRKPCLRDGGRAMRLARRLRLGIDPSRMATARGTAIEVYPHTALVSLFALPKILQYKARPNRSFAMRHAEFRRLVTCLLELRCRRPALDVASSPRWPAIVEALRAAQTRRDLERLEDELDAYVCAYIAMYHSAHRGSRRTAVIGDTRGGYIVTPVDETRYEAMIRAARERRIRIA